MGLGLMASKYSSKNKDDKYIYTMMVYKPEDYLNKKYFKFALVSDDNTVKTDFNKLSGEEGSMVIKTKSLLDFEPDDICIWVGNGNNQKYSIVNVDGDRKASGEQAMALFGVKNGNVPIVLTLRKAG